MIKIKYIAIILFIVEILLGCQKRETCSSIISELINNGCSSKELSKALNIPEKLIKNPNNYHFSESDSIFLFSLAHAYKETGKLPNNLYQLYNKSKQSHVIAAINNYRQEEIKSNEIFVHDLSKKIVDKQNKNLNDFIEEEINSFKSLRFLWKSPEEINDALGESISDYFDDIEIAKIYNDSCASYIKYINRFRENGVNQYVKKNIVNKNLNTIGTDIRGFVPHYKFENSISHVTYQLLATIDRAQDVLFSPINWILGLIPQWLSLTISILLLLILIFCLCTGQLHFGLVDLVLLIISAIVFFWGDPYSETREAMSNQVTTFYEDKIENELLHLNEETNKYYDKLIQTIGYINTCASSRKFNGVQANNETGLEGTDRTNNERSWRTNNKNGGEIDIETDHNHRSEASDSVRN